MKLFQWISKLLGYLIYLPNIMPLTALFKSEIFPWAFLYSLRKDTRLTTGYAVFLIYILISTLLGVSGLSSILGISRAFFALVNASLIFFLLIHIKKEEYTFLCKAFEFVFAANVVLCLVQFLGLFPVFLEPVFEIFIDRFTAGIFGGGRGVAGLFAEPSYASLSIHYYFAFFMLNRRVNPKSLFGAVLIMGMILFDLFIIRSVTGLVMIFIYFVSLQKRADILRGGAVLLALVVGLIYFIGPTKNAPRSISTAYDFFKYGEYKDPQPWLLEQSGFRFVSVWAAYQYGLKHPLGSGIGNWGPASIEAMDDVGVNASAMSFFATAAGSEYMGVRPTSYAAGLMLETGVVGLFLFFIAFGPFVVRKKLYEDVHTRSLSLFFLFNIFALGSIGDPIPFIFFAFAYRNTNNE